MRPAIAEIAAAFRNDTALANLGRDSNADQAALACSAYSQIANSAVTQKLFYGARRPWCNALSGAAAKVRSNRHYPARMSSTSRSVRSRSVESGRGLQRGRSRPDLSSGIGRTG